MEIRSIKELIVELMFFDTLNGESIPEAIVTLDQGYRLLKDKEGEVSSEQRAETIALSLDWLLLDDDGLLTRQAKKQLAQYDWHIDNIDKSIFRFNYVLRCKNFDIFFGD